MEYSKIPFPYVFKFTKLFQLSDKFLLHIVINVAVAGEGYGTVGVTGQRAHEVGVLDATVQIAAESLTRHMAAGDFVNGDLFLLPCQGVYDCNHPCDSGGLEDFLDGVIVALGADERKKSGPFGIAVQNFPGD